MNRLCARFSGNIKNQVSAQIRLRGWRRSQSIRLIRFEHMQSGAISVRINSDCSNSEFTAGTPDAERNLAAIRDQNFTEGGSTIRHGKKGF